MREDQIPPANDSSVVRTLEMGLIRPTTHNPTHHPAGLPLRRPPSSTAAVPFGLPAVLGNPTRSLSPILSGSQNMTEFHSLRNLRSTPKGTTLHLHPRSLRRAGARVSAWWTADRFLDLTVFGGLRERDRASKVHHRTGTREDRHIYPPELPCLDQAGTVMLTEGS